MREERLTWSTLSSFKTKQCSAGPALQHRTTLTQVTNKYSSLSQLAPTILSTGEYSLLSQKNILKQRLVALTVSNRKYFILLGMIYLHPFPSLSDFLIWGDFENLSDPGKIQWSRVAKSLTRHADLGFIELWENPFISQSSAPALGQTTPDLTLIKSQDHEICFIRAVRLSVIISRFSELVLA